MSEKVRKYNKHSIEICRNCHGGGATFNVPDAYVVGSHPHTAKPETCDVCGGSGRIDKELDITITIRPHRT